MLFLKFLSCSSIEISNSFLFSIKNEPLNSYKMNDYAPEFDSMSIDMFSIGVHIVCISTRMSMFVSMLSSSGCPWQEAKIDPLCSRRK